MPAPQLARNLKSTVYTARETFGDYVKRRPVSKPAGLSEAQQTALESLRRDGYAVIESYWTREKAFALRDKLEQYLQPEESRDFDSGAYIRFWDDRNYDEGVRRLYHVEKELPELQEYRRDPFSFGIIDAYYGFPMYSAMLMYQHNTKSNANTRYYHVDVFSKEFKSFIYLDDVDVGNGPFTYLPGTHTSHFRRMRKQLLWDGTGASTSFSDEDLGSLLKREQQITGPAGTMILADVRGFHRGSPQLERSRSALVNYIYRHEGDLFLDR